MLILFKIHICIKLLYAGGKVMIRKIISIKNFGTFTNFSIGKSDWDGTLKRINTIYGTNGKGKTSFALIIRSLDHNDSLIQKKKIEKSAPLPQISFIDGDGKNLFYNNGWNKHIDNIEVFDSFYLEDNIYTISYSNKADKLNMFEMPIKDKVIGLKNQYNENMIALKKVRYQISYLEHIKNSYGDQYKGKKNLDSITTLKKEKTKIEATLSKIETQLNLLSNEQRLIYVDKVNKYLELFGTDIKITEFKLVSNIHSETHKLIYGINIGTHKLGLQERLSSDSNSLKYFLSDGDKNSLALSFFLAKFDIIPNPENYIVVCDDPFTSFDTDRKRTTINLLIKLAKKVDQFFLLTHDLYFKNDFINGLDCDFSDIKITTKNNSSGIFLQYTKKEMTTGLIKDISTIRDFVSNPNDEQIYLREVIRCLRPSIEGLFRIKYFNYINEKQWLGDFIKLIIDCDIDSPIYRLKSILEEIEVVNDYSKIYHHSNPTYLETQISANELKVYCKKTLHIIENI